MPNTLLTNTSLSSALHFRDAAGTVMDFSTTKKAKTSGLLIAEDDAGSLGDGATLDIATIVPGTNRLYFVMFTSRVQNFRGYLDIVITDGVGAKRDEYFFVPSRNSVSYCWIYVTANSESMQIINRFNNALGVYGSIQDAVLEEIPQQPDLFN